MLWHVLPCAGVLLPSVTIEYRDVRVCADALVGSAGIPSLFNVARAFLKVPNLHQTLNHPNIGPVAAAGMLRKLLSALPCVGVLPVMQGTFLAEGILWSSGLIPFHLM